MPHVEPALRVLVVEDNPDDLVLLELELRRGGLTPQVRRVETAEEMRQALALSEWDVIISDYVLPLFSAPEALKVLQETGQDIPFIVISGGVGEQEGVEMMRAGARDYFPKDRITRLAAAVTRELSEAGARRARRRAELERALLGRVGEVLTAPLDFEQWLARLVRVPVPAVADGCAIFLLEEEGQRLRMAALAHDDAEKAAQALEVARCTPLREDSPVGPSYVLRTGQPELLVEAAGHLERIARDEEHARLLRALNLRSVLHVPLMGHHGTIGVLSLATSGARRLAPGSHAALPQLIKNHEVSLG
jgi:CheY-like chemotaxis protein